MLVFSLSATLWRFVRSKPLVTTSLLILVLIGCGFASRYVIIKEWETALRELENDRPKEALAKMKWPLRIWPRNVEVHVKAARAARLSGELPLAESYLNHALTLGEDEHHSIQLEFLLFRAQTGEIDEVAPILIEAAEKPHPEAPFIMDTLALAYMNRLRYRPAIACLNRRIDLAPGSAKAHYLRGWVLERLNQHKKAKEDYITAIQLDPSMIPVRLRVAELLIEENQAPEAMPYLEKLIADAPDNPEVQARLGMCRFLQGQTEDARKLMESAVVKLPKDIPLLAHLAKLDLQAGRSVEAERWARSILQQEKSDTEAMFLLGSALSAQGKTEESAKVMQEYERSKDIQVRSNKLLQDVADSPSATAADYAELGDLLIQSGRERNGVQWLHRALDMEPRHQRSHQVLLAYYESKGEKEKADEHRKMLTSTSPSR